MTQFQLFRYPVILMLIMLVSTSNLSEAQSAAEIQTIRNLRYDQQPGVDPDLLSVDVYTRSDADGWPVMVYVHGGAWQVGDKSNVFLKPEFFLNQGYVFVSVNYRLTPQVDFPVHAQDVGHAVASVIDFIDRYGGDGGQLYLMGHSAGAHLVALIGTDESYLAAQAKPLSDLKAVVPIDTQAYDLVDLAARSGGELSSAYQPVFGDDPEFWAMASPITYVAAEKGIPPMVVAYSGGNNGSNPNRGIHADNFADALRAAGVKAEVVGSVEQTHAEINRQFGAASDPVTEAVMRFLDDVSTP
jgi:acetyl esterase/lipase